MDFILEGRYSNDIMQKGMKYKETWFIGSCYNIPSHHKLESLLIEIQFVYNTILVSEEQHSDSSIIYVI